MTTSTDTPFVVLYDYRCPFANNVHGHLLAAMEAGLELKVTLEPYTLSQGSVPEGSPPAWEDPAHDGALMALEASVAARSVAADSFLKFHGALFAARHERSIALTTKKQIDDVLAECGIEADPVWDEVASGRPRQVIAESWTHYHDDLDVFGVPTFVVDDSDATFVRLMSGPDQSDPGASVAVVTRLLDLIVNQADINELKHTRLSR